MKIYLSLGMGVLMLAACSHSAKVSDKKIQVPADYHAQLEKQVAAELLEETKYRGPAQESAQLKVLKAQLGDLNFVKPGKFEVYVFPKMRELHHKEISQDDKAILLGKPQVSEVSIKAVTKCKNLVEGQFAKYSPKEYFTSQDESQPSVDLKATCAIVEVSSRSMRDANRSLLREGDVFAKRLYLDSYYNIWGIETDYYSSEAKNDQKLATVGMKLVPGSHSTSGLDFLPVDLPSVGKITLMDVVDSRSVFASKSMQTDFSFKATGSLLDRMALRQISRINKKFKIPQCAMRKMKYKDHFRKPVEMYWCEGLPWPQVVDSLQFVAVTQNISVR